MEEFLKKLIEFNIRLAKRLAAEDMKMFEEIVEMEKQYHSKWALKPGEEKTDPIYENLPPKEQPAERQAPPPTVNDAPPVKEELSPKINVDFDF